MVGLIRSSSPRRVRSRCYHPPSLSNRLAVTYRKRNRFHPCNPRHITTHDSFPQTVRFPSPGDSLRRVTGGREWLIGQFQFGLLNKELLHSMSPHFLPHPSTRLGVLYLTITQLVIAAYMRFHYNSVALIGVSLKTKTI
jgi:hypothetical protein